LLSSSSEKETENDEIVVKAGSNGARFFLLATLPLKEPVAWGGPIVMNTEEELDEAFRELNERTFIKHAKPRSL
jgi:redox-sensitive bicupin YhaK (pirin superfamily)